MFCNNLCSWFSKNIVSHYRQERLSRQSSYPGKSIFPPDFSFLFIIFLSFEPERIQCWLPIFKSDQERWTVSCFKTLLDEGRSVVWVHQIDNREIGQWTLNISRVSLLLFVVLIHMLISGAVMKIFYLGRGGGGGKGAVPSSSLKVTRGKKRRGGGGDKEIR